MKSLIIAIAAVCLFMALGHIASAQFPGGVCPANAYPQAHWTYPGEIRAHLASGHGFDASGMTRAQAEAAHDRLHNSGVASRSRFGTVQQQQSTGRKRFFGRRR